MRRFCNEASPAGLPSARLSRKCERTTMEKLSILIPTYNKDCLLLVDALAQQIDEFAIDAEIVVVDDGSSDLKVLAENASIESIEHCRYIVSPVNCGIAITRNRLMNEAKGVHLLFLDSDTYPVDDDFLIRLIAVADDADVIVGGIEYRKGEETVANPLRLRYGKSREERSVAERSKKPYDAFNSSNFMISRKVAETVKFDETFDRYGHEDTLYGAALKKAGFSIKHVDAPVYHDNTDTSEQYLSKVRIAIQSLSMHADKLRGSSRLLSLYDKIDALHLTGFVSSFFGRFRNPMEKNLKGAHPSMIILMIYKITYLCGVMKL